MSCSKGRVAPSDTTKLRLFADSGGYCQNPGCLAELFVALEEDVVHIAEMAHVISAADKGPRAQPSLSPEQRASYENLILLCPRCHTVIDKAEDAYPEQVVLEWKRRHKQRIANQFGLRRLESRQAARSAVAPLLAQNLTIFESYGPLTEERFNPESSLPRLWLRKIREQIIPNNRKLLAICDANYVFLREPERGALEQFRQHVDDFEAKHLANAKVSGRTFPDGMKDIFA